MTRIRVLFTGGSLSPEHMNRLRREGLDVEVTRVDLTPAQLTAALADKDAYILAGVEHVSEEVLRAAARLRVIAFLGVGYHAFVDAAAAAEHGIAVTNAPGANARAVAEFTIALMLDAARRVTHLVNETKAGRWPALKAANLEGKTLGIVGLGAIGTKVARIASHGFDMQVVYSSRKPKPEVEADTGARFLPLHQVLGAAHVISLHTALVPETRGLLSRERVEQIRRGAILVNTSESELVDPIALRRALLDGRIAAAAMDGYYVEPVPGPDQDPHGLLALPDERLLVTPHTANATDESFDAMLTANVQSIVGLLRHGDDPRVVNRGFREHASWLPPVG